MHTRLSIRFRRPQQFAALLLLLLLGQCLWVSDHQTLTERDYDFARCGRETWEKPTPLAGYYTTCGNIRDGILAYRAAGLPLTVQRILLGQSSDTSTWEMRHQLSYVLFLLHSLFLLAGLALGAALWWVTRRLYGNDGGAVALGLYCLSPAVVHGMTYPNNEILAAFGLFASVYLAMGVAHALQGPARSWRPRIVLLVLAFGFTAASHAAAFLLALFLALGFMIYLAVGRRAPIIPVMMAVVLGSLLLVFACYSFNADAFSYYFRSGAARLWLSGDAAQRWILALPNAAIAIAAAVALLLYLTSRRSRYFGNTAPLLVAALLFVLTTPGTFSDPTLWALPFLLAFVGGVFADALEGPRRRVLQAAIGAILLLEAGLSVGSLALHLF